MTLLLLSFLGGVLTILSPCVLPVLPFVFARADRPFVQSGLPLLAGMAATFALVATLAAVGGAWVAGANQAGRIAAMLLLALFGVTLLFPSVADRLTRPLVAFGNRLSNTAAKPGEGARSVGASLLLGVATGFLWAPCAGPILGLILTGAAIEGASIGTTFLLLAYGLGACASLAVALFAGGRVFAALKRSLGVGEWVRRGLGALVLAGVVAIAFGLDTGLLSRISAEGTARTEQALLQRAGVSSGPARSEGALDVTALPVEGTLPEFPEGAAWINSPPLTAAELRGKVVLIDFWTYSCINCLRSLPYVRAWAEKYRESGLVVIGVHAPEFAFERDAGNVRRAVANLDVGYPVVLDNNFTLWRAFDNHYWPAHYFIDAEGNMRHHHFGEGGYAESERVIQALLREAGQTNVPSGIVDPNAPGAGAPANTEALASPETYVGYARAQNFVSPPQQRDAAATYSTPSNLQLNQWGLSGDWTVRGENATAVRSGATIHFRFRARDLHLVLSPAAGGAPVRFRVTIDGASPGASHGGDINAAGEGRITEERLYQLVRTQGPIRERTFEIEFLDPGANAFAFTFG
ncbi:MAG: cytochrome c biogenesis protein DipZ [Terricaulis sp.]